MIGNWSAVNNVMGSIYMAYESTVHSYLRALLLEQCCSSAWLRTQSVIPSQTAHSSTQNPSPHSKWLGLHSEIKMNCSD